MSSDVLYLIGTAATWLGWIALGVTLYRIFGAMTKPAGAARSADMKGVASSAIASAAGFLVAIAVPMNAVKSAPGFKLPIVWIVMPFAAWAAFACLCFAVYRAYQMILDRPVGVDENTRSQAERFGVWVRQAIVAIILGLVFFWLFERSGDGAKIITGAIPMNLSVAIALALLALAAIILMAVGARAASSRGIAKTFVAHVALIIGSIVFGLPFAWLVITSFKEDQDMSSPNGLIWIPRVSETMPYRNPADPLYETRYKGETVQASVIEREPGGMLKLDIQRPMSLRGSTFAVQPAALKEIDRQAPLVTGTYNGRSIKGLVVQEMDDGRRKVSILDPPIMKGATYIANPADVQPVRHVGLRWQNYTDAVSYHLFEEHSCVGDPQCDRHAHIFIDRRLRIFTDEISWPKSHVHDLDQHHDAARRRYPAPNILDLQIPWLDRYAVSAVGARVLGERVQRVLAAPVLSHHPARAGRCLQDRWLQPFQDFLGGDAAANQARSRCNRDLDLHGGLE